MESQALVQKMDILGKLPPELVQEICKFLCRKSINNALVCSKRWNDLIDYDYYWLKQCSLKGFKKIEKNARSVFYENYVNKFSSPWKGIYNYHSITENWKNNKFKRVVVDSSFFEIHHFDDEVLIATTNLEELYVIDSATGCPLFYHATIYGYIHCVVRYKTWVFFLDKGYLFGQNFAEKGLPYYTEMKISGSWYFATFIEPHENFVAVLVRGNGLSIFQNSVLGFFELVYSNENARSICFADGKIVMGTNRGTIEILNFEFENMVTLEYHQDRVTFWRIMMNDDYLVSFHGNSLSVDNDGNIVSVWSLKHQICLYSYKEKVNVLPGVTLLNQALLLCLETNSSEDINKIVILDLNSGKHLLKIDSGQSEVSTLTTNGHLVFTTSRLLTKVWCMSTSRFIGALDDVHSYSYYTFKVTRTKMAHIRTQSGILELRDYQVDL